MVQSGDQSPALEAEDLPELLQQSQLLQSLVHSFPLSVWIKNPEGVFLCCNQHFEALLGVPETEIIGKRDYDFMPVAQADTLLKQDQAAIAAGQPMRHEDWLEFPTTGYRGLFEILTSPLYNTVGNLIGVLGLSRELTQQRETENRLKRLNQSCTVLSAVNQAVMRIHETKALFAEVCQIAVTRGNFRIAWMGLKPLGGDQILPICHAGCSQGYVENLHLSLMHNHGPTSQTLRNGIYHICQDIATDPAMEPWREAALERGYRSSASFAIFMQGEVIASLNLYADQPYFFDDEQIALLQQLSANLSFALEIAAHQKDRQQALEALLEKRTEELQKNEQRFRHLIESIQRDYFFFSLDANQCLTYLSPSASVFLGKSLEELLHHPWYEVLPIVPEAQELKQRLREPLQNDLLATPYELEIEVQSERCILEITQHLTCDAQGQVLGSEGVAKDITRRKQIEAALREARDRAERASQAKSQYLSHMSHELRTPLNAIISFSELLQEEIQEPRWQGYLQTITRSGHSLLQLINDILDLSKIEAGKLLLHHEAVALRPLIQDLETLLRFSFEKKGLEFLIQLSENLPAGLWLDPLRIRQILLNLLNNAYKYTAQGQVSLEVSWLSLSPEKGQLRLSVSDTGPGISAEFQARIFEPFAQDPTSRLIGSGTGLGLPITRNLVELMGGQLLLNSQIGQGTTFTILLPEVTIAEASTSTADSQPVVRFAPATLLLVDDLPQNLELLEAYLAGQPLTCLRAYNGQEACEQALRHRPDLILMDIKMPVMDGGKALQALRSYPQMARIPVVALTAFSFQQEENSLLHQGFNAYLRKPISKNTLFHCLERFLPVLSETPSQDTPLTAQEAYRPLASGAATAPSMQQLNQILQQVWIPRWQSIQNSLILDDLENFARGLQTLAEQYAHPGLLNLAQKLLDALQRFELEAVQNLLQSFPQDCTAALAGSPQD